ncbi:uncharacterized protein EAE97_000091 [Botrytis byssoidea]|uniref:Uncharacterized protein n=1 Tax=Botrytis byssoidea TaxID=139641 RepID=A0A9P5IX75_9HELO|nr:uncharacterized protein EAE97_000091 [Botrytis byssoidea]KAF7954832.1 hypothetical protein EAE97_000091 [Botrytis byssoidea]
MAGKNTELISLGEDLERTYKHIMCLTQGNRKNDEEYHSYKHEMVFDPPTDDEETLEMAAATLLGVPREPRNEFHMRKEQEGVCKNAEMEAFREFRKQDVLKDGEYVYSKHARYVRRATKQARPG